MGQLFVAIAVLLALFPATGRAEADARTRPVSRRDAGCLRQLSYAKGTQTVRCRIRNSPAATSSSMPISPRSPQYHARSGDRHRQVDRPSDISGDPRRKAAGRQPARSGDAVAILPRSGGRGRQGDGRYLRSLPPIYNAISAKSHYDEPLPAIVGPACRAGGGAAKGGHGRVWRVSRRAGRPLHGLSYPAAAGRS